MRKIKLRDHHNTRINVSLLEGFRKGIIIFRCPDRTVPALELILAGNIIQLTYVNESDLEQDLELLDQMTEG